jgi:hypothetical protein
MSPSILLLSIAFKEKFVNEFIVFNYVFYLTIMLAHFFKVGTFLAATYALYQKSKVKIKCNLKIISIVFLI